MPRPTKAQKEARGFKSRASNTDTRPKTGTGAQKKGFQTKPARAPKDAYLGKARKIKADLIQRAKMKKQYARVLKEEGMTSARLDRDRGQPAPVADAEADIADQEATGQAEAGEAREASGSTSSAPGHGGLAAQAQAPTPWSRKGKGRASWGPTDGGSMPTPLPPTAAGRRRALSPSAIGHPEPLANESLRTMKKEAFAKFHQPGRARGGAGGGGLNGARGKGQPNMGARMGVLLEKIRRDRTS